MSQSDYIKYKRTRSELGIGKLPNILEPSQYESFVNYAVENTVKNNKVVYSQLIPQNTQTIYNMEVAETKYCVPFQICTNTNTRSNRTPILSPIGSIQPGKYNKIQTVYCCKCIKGRNCYCNKKICKSKTQQICMNCKH